MNFHELPTVFEDVGLALLSILIALAIAILTDIFQKKESDFADLDQLVILKSIFKVTRIVAYALIIFFPFVFWGTSIFWNVIAIFLSGAGIFLLAKAILDIYKWVSGDYPKNKRRLSYLKQVKDPEEMKRAWKSVWATDKIDSNQEIQYLELFSSCLEKLTFKGSESVVRAATLLKDFAERISARSGFSLVVNGGFLSRLLKLDYEVWKEWENLLDDKSLQQEVSKLNEWGNFDYICRSTTSAIVEIEKLGLKRKEGYAIFKCLKEHIESHRKETDQGDSIYIIRLFASFYEELFSVISDLGDEMDNVVYLFPKEWKITKSNLISYQNPVCKISFDNFCQWAFLRIFNAKENSFDQELDYAMNLLFPEVNPIVWADILIFAITPYNENRVASAIHYHKVFGLSGRGYWHPIVNTIHDSGSDVFHKMMGNTFELALNLFSDTFTLENIESFQKAATKLQHDANTEQVDRIHAFQYIFKNIRERLEKSSGEDVITTQ
jgi:hypothetical protein